MEKLTLAPVITLGGFDLEKYSKLIEEKKEFEVEFNCVIYTDNKYKLYVTYDNDEMNLRFTGEKETEAFSGVFKEYDINEFKKERKVELLDEAIRSCLVYVLPLY